MIYFDNNATTSIDPDVLDAQGPEKFDSARSMPHIPIGLDHTHPDRNSRIENSFDTSDRALPTSLSLGNLLMDPRIVLVKGRGYVNSTALAAAD